MSQSTAIAKANENTRNLTLKAYEDFSGDTGYEGITGSDLSIPFITVLQGISPEVLENNPEGARPGMFMNTITKELYDGEKTGIIFQPVYFEKKYVEWIPRAKGGGWVGSYNATDPEVKAAQLHSATKNLGYGKLETPSGNQLVETLYFYGHILNETGTSTNGFVVLACTSTKIRPAQAFLTVMRTTMKGKIPMWGWRTRIVTVKEKNDQGTFSNIQFKPVNGVNWVDGVILPSDSLFEEGKNLREMIIAGRAKIDPSQQDRPSATSKNGNDEVPF